MTSSETFPLTLPGDAASAVSPAERNVGHGHVWPRPDGRRSRCGGPALCRTCAGENAHRAAAEQEARAAASRARGSLLSLLALLDQGTPVPRAEVRSRVEDALRDLPGGGA